MRTYRHGTQRGIKKHEQGSQDWEASFMLAGSILITVNGYGLDDDSSIKAYLDGLDFKKVERVFSQ
ncbi:MAG: hypothetical protein ACWA5Q_01940 [bacterium]